MAWKIEFSSRANKDLEKLDSQSQKLIKDYLDDRLLKLAHPKQAGKALTNSFKGLWRYRVDNFRIICKIQENKLIILVLQIGHRSEVYN